MTFFWPAMLSLLVVPVALGVAGWVRAAARGTDRHPRITRGEAGLRNAELLPQTQDDRAGLRRRSLRPWLCAGIALAVVALARPQWGRTTQTTITQSRDIILALDLSRSMLTPDVKPSRLERSKLLVQALLDQLRGERVGLIVFSGTAFLQSPLSADYGILRDFLPSLGPDTLPEGGTNYKELIDTALDAFGDSSGADRTLIILSDGEATDQDWRDRVPELARKGIHVIGLGVGTAAGGMIPDGQGDYMKDETGAVVVSHLEPATLQELASVTGGAYRNGSQWVDLQKLIATTVAHGRTAAVTEHRDIRGADRYQWFLAPAFLCLILSFWLEFPANPAPRDLRLAPPALAALLALGLLIPGRASALPPGNGAGSPDAADPAANLSRIAGRLSASGSTNAHDWADFAQTTTEWGERVQSGGATVPPGPVNDGLAAVDAGETADPTAADWPALRARLSAFLKKAEPPPQQKQPKQSDQNQSKQSQSKQSQSEQNRSQNQADQKQSKQSQSDQNRGRQSQANPGSQPTDPADRRSRQQDQKQGQPQKAEQGRGDRSDANTRAAQAGETQKVGGVRAPRPSEAELRNPDLALPLEKLEELRNQDSPAELYQLLRKQEPAPPPTLGKNW